MASTEGFGGLGAAHFTRKVRVRYVVEALFLEGFAEEHDIAGGVKQVPRSSRAYAAYAVIVCSSIFQNK